tara:strand:+ start:1946 stop:2767 length:822 start_codon:yes stop_codon:yes gene_type:complete
MKNLRMFCISLEPSHYNFIKNLGYEPVGLGEKNFDYKWLTDSSKINISTKNKYYGEYTYHYWIWKNYLNHLNDEWIGFCQYRKFWSFENFNKKDINFKSLNHQVIKEIPDNLNKYESILGEPIFINQFRLMKFLKKGLKFFVKRPETFFNANKRNLNFHFDFSHGEYNLSKAIDLLDDKNREDFRKYVNTKVSFNPHNMFICKSKDKLKKYYEDLFPWLEKCEKLFGFKDLQGFGKIRIYTFLAERFLPYWFNKNTKSTTLPIIFYDIRNDIN